MAGVSVEEATVETQGWLFLERLTLVRTNQGPTLTTPTSFMSCISNNLITLLHAPPLKRSYCDSHITTGRSSFSKHETVVDKTKPYLHCNCLHSVSLKLRENQLAQTEIKYTTDAFKYLLLTI